MLTRGRRPPFRPSPRRPSPTGEVAGFKSERWPLSNRNRGRLQIGMVVGFKSEKVAAFGWNLQVNQRDNPMRPFLANLLVKECGPTAVDYVDLIAALIAPHGMQGSPRTLELRSWLATTALCLPELLRNSLLSIDKLERIMYGVFYGNDNSALPFLKTTAQLASYQQH
jgi:hypothetical protein